MTKREATATTLREQGGGLLQLKLGRAAQGHGLWAAFGLAFNAFLIYAGNQSATVVSLPPAYLEFALWLLSLTVGAFIAADGLARKWVAYKGYRSSRHFVLTGLAFGLSLAGIGLIFTSLTGLPSSSLAALTWVMYPLSVSTIAIGLISMADTWQGHGFRKVVSVAAALALPGFMALWVLIGVNPKDTIFGGSLLATFFYFIMALAAHISGSMLHIIASSTSTAEREILSASDVKLAQLQSSLNELQKALEFRQRGLDEKEAIIESDRKELDSELAKAEVQSQELRTLEAALEKKDKELGGAEKKVSGVRAEIDARVEQLKMRESEVATLESGAEKARRDVAERDSALMERDKELKRVAIDLTTAQRQIESKVRAAAELEEKLKREDSALGARLKELLQKEKAIQLKESHLQLKGEQVDATKATKDKERIRELQDWEKKILAKEKDLGQLEVELKTLEDQLKERYENATNIEKRAADDRKHLEAKERELLAREKMISDKESGVEHDTSEIGRMKATVKDATARLKEKEAQYEELLKNTKVQQATASSSQDELNRRAAALDARQKKLDEMHTNLKSEIDRVTKENRELLQTQKELERREQDVSLKTLELETKARETRAAATTPGIKDMDREAGLARWQEDLEKKADELKRRQYEMEKELDKKAQSLRAQVEAGVTEGAAEVTVEEKKERVKSGTARLDDLLYGGLPFNSNVLFTGPPFVGKEVVILNFIAEGLKKGIPGIMITTAKPPPDIAKEMAPILPTFVEYEQLGLVHWIDCSSGGSSPGKPSREKNVWKVSGPTDYDGILKVVNELDKEFHGKHPYFRLGCLSLSSCISNPDQNAAMNFVQRLVNRLRQTKTVAAFSLERGMHTDQQVESIEHLMDGAVHFKSEKQKTMLQVVGLGEVQTRDWVPYKHSNKAIMIGSFQLERIR